MSTFSSDALLAFLQRVEKLKSVPRHCVTTDGVLETVAAHSWRVALLALLLRDEFPDADMDKVIRMCLIHDIGEAVTGDIPTFVKGEKEELTEKQAIGRLLAILPQPLCGEFSALFAEMDALETKEAKIYKALDKLEAVIQHNEAGIDTWLPLEYELQQTYAAKNVAGFPCLESLQAACVQETLRMIREKEDRLL